MVTFQPDGVDVHSEKSVLVALAGSLAHHPLLGVPRTSSFMPWALDLEICVMSTPLGKIGPDVHGACCT